MPKLLGIVGALVICAGLDLLWQSRHEIRFWAGAHTRVFRAMLRRDECVRAFPTREAAEKRHGAIRFLLGMGFAFFLGPMLVVLGLTLMLYTNL